MDADEAIPSGLNLRLPSLKPTRLAADLLIASYPPACAGVKAVWADSPSRLMHRCHLAASSPAVRRQSRRAAWLEAARQHAL
jgi:hypothetical protein